MKQFKRLSDLNVWGDNYNQGDVVGIARSIRMLGHNRAVALWHDDNIRAGNHTTIALRLIQVEGPKPEIDKSYPPNNVRLDTDGEWLVDWVDITHLNAEEATAFAIADNAWARRAVTDDELLLSYLYGMDVDLLTATGFTDQDLAALEASIDELDALGSDLESTVDALEEAIPEQYLIMIDCRDETEQITLLERFMKEGLPCRALLS